MPAIKSVREKILDALNLFYVGLKDIFILNSDIVDSCNSISSNKPLSARQGNILTNYIDEVLTTTTDEISDLRDQILDLTYPIGAIYMSVNSTNPGTLFGGTWVAWGAGKVPVGVNSSETEFNTVEKTGGAKTHTLTEEQLPSHTHSFAHTHGTPSKSISSSGAHTHNTSAKSVSDILSVDGTALKWGDVAGEGTLGGIVSPGRGSKQLAINIPTLNITSSGAHTHTVPAMTTNSQSTSNTGSAGGGEAHNNLQPYITCYMWKRTA